MHTLFDLTNFVTFQHEAAEEQLWECFSGQVYAQVLAAEQDSLVVRVRQRFSLRQVVAACEGYRRYAGGAGQPADYPVLRLCWALLLRYLLGWSLRTLEHQMRVNLLVRWCTHFALQEETPDHSTLARFETWVREHALDVMFVTVLKQIDADFPDDARELQCGDTFGVWAKVADVSLNTLLRQSCRRLLLALEAAMPPAYADCVAQMDLTALFGVDDERSEQRLSPTAREARTLATAQAALDCLATVQQVTPLHTGCDTETAPTLANLHHWCGVVEKILTDEFTDKPLLPPKSTRRKANQEQAQVAEQSAVTTETAAAPAKVTADATVAAADITTLAAALDATTPPDTAPTPSLPMPVAPATSPATLPPSLRRCTDAERGSYRIVSATDTDATVRKHGESILIGYNADVLATANFVRGIQANTGATPDGATVAPSIARHLERFGFAPQRLVYDRAAGTPKHIADVRRTSEGQTQLVARQINYGQRHTRFAPTDFTLGAGALTCPNGVTTTRAYRTGGADGFDYRFLAIACQGCPLWAQCRDPKSRPDSHRTVFISDYTLRYKAEIDYLATPAAQADFAFRANIERHIAGLTQHNGARYAKVIGLTKVNFQLTMAATAYNLKRWHVLTLAKERQGCKEKPPCPTSLYPPP